MKYINDVNINEAVMHVLDRDAKEPLLNDFPLELNEDTYNYINNLIVKCLNDEKLLYANFLDKEVDPEIKVLSQNYFNIDACGEIIEVSKDIAKRLFEIIKSNCNLSSSDLLVASLLTDQGPMLAILKMDYEDKNFKHNIEFKDEKIEISLVKDHEGLPKTAGKVQKAAFIIPTGSDIFNLMILDKNRGKDASEPNYFVNTFLKAQYIANERDITRKFLKCMEAWIIRKCACTAIKAEDTRSIIRKYCTEGDTIVIEDLADELYSSENDNEEFIDFCKVVGLPKEIVIDRTWFDKHKSKILLNIENDIKLELSSGVYNNPNRFEIQANLDGSINFVVKNVMNYKEK